MLSKSQFKHYRAVLESALINTRITTSATLLSNSLIATTSSISHPRTFASYTTSSLLSLPSLTPVPSCGAVTHSPPSFAQASPADASIWATLHSTPPPPGGPSGGASAASLTLTVASSSAILLSFTLPFKNVHSHPAVCPYPLQWSPDGQSLLVFGEEKPQDKDTWKEQEYPDQWQYSHGWGEKCKGSSNVSVLVVKVPKGAPGQVWKLKGIQQLGQQESNIRLTWPVWVGDHKIGWVGIEGSLPSGIQYCMNKRSGIYIVEEMDLDLVFPKKEDEKEKKDDVKEEDKEKKEEFKGIKISGHDPTALYPMASSDGSKIAYLYTDVYNENHMFNTGLKVYDVATKTTEIIIPRIETNDELSLYVYNGYYSNAFKWEGNHSLVFINNEMGASVLTRVNIETKKREKFKLSVDFQTDVCIVQEFQKGEGKNGVLFILNNLYHPSRVCYLEDYDVAFKDPASAVIRVESKSDIQYVNSSENKEENFSFIPEGQIFEEVHIDGDVYSYIWGMKDDTKPMNERPVFLDLHGGPHVYTPARYSTLSSILLKRGFLIMTVNYSGSWSYGQDLNERLAGRIGEIDTNEIIRMLTKLQDEGLLTKNDVHFDGGSYSGYQGACMLQQHPHFFKSITIANPVVNLLYMQFASDIPEWVFHEGLGGEEEFKYDRDLTDEEIQRLKKHSPALLPFDKTSKTRTLLLLGDSDLRVNPRGGYYIYKKWENLGLNITCKVYEGEGHHISRPDHAFDVLLNILHNVLQDSVE